MHFCEKTHVVEGDYAENPPTDFFNLFILVHVTIYRRLRICRNGHLDQSEAYDIS